MVEEESSLGSIVGKVVCGKCGTMSVKPVEFDQVPVCENCCDQLAHDNNNNEQPLFVIKTKIFADLLTAPNLLTKTGLLFDDMDMVAGLRNIKASKSIQTEFEDENRKRSEVDGDDDEDRSIEIYNFSKFKFANELESVQAVEEMVRKPKRPKSKYVQLAEQQQQSLTKIGHRECVVPFFGVPPNHGWSWDLEKANNLAVGWKPGAIDHKVHKIMLSNKKAPEKVTEAKSTGPKRSRCDQSTSMSK